MKYSKKTWSLSLLASALLITSCGQSFQPLAQMASPVAEQMELSSFAQHEMRTLHQELDQNGDQLLSPQEIEAAPQDMALFDQNHDLQLDSSELERHFSNEVQRLSGLSAQLKPDPALFDQSAYLRAKSRHRFSNPQLNPNQVELFIDGATIFPMVFETLDQAKKSIQVDFFVLGGDIGMQLAQKLGERQRAGIQVQVMVDPNLGFVGQTKKQMQEVIAFLKMQKIPLRMYPLFHIPSPRGLLKGKAQIDHNKLIVVDGSTAILGGMNFFEFGVKNHDIMFRIQGGPLAPELSELMLSDWELPSKKELQNQAYLHRLNQSPQAEQALVRLTKTDAFEKSTKDRLLANIQQAQQSIEIAVMELSDGEMIQALIQAQQRGVKVRALLDPRSNTSQYFFLPLPQGIPNLLPAREFLKTGVETRWFVPAEKHQELHMKLAIFDGRTVMAGSTNFTTQALNTFRETGIELQGQAIPQRLVQMFNQDWQKAQPVQKLKLGQKMTARLVEYMDKRYLGWW